jgi:hypothetical protein
MGAALEYGAATARPEDGSSCCEIPKFKRK